MQLKPWKLKDLIVQAKSVQQYHPFLDHYIPAKPLNNTKEFISFTSRLHRAWLVFTCQADVFIWPADEFPES